MRKVRSLRKRAGFVALTNRGEHIGRSCLVLQIATPITMSDSSIKRLRFSSNCSDTDIMVGLTVTKKVGNAVERNRIRRRLRNAFCLLSSTSSAITNNGIYVIIGRRAALNSSFEFILSEMRSAAQQLRARLRLDESELENNLVTRNTYRNKQKTLKNRKLSA